MSEIIYIASDHGGYNLKNHIIEYFVKNNIKYEDLGCYSEESCDYPDYAKKAVTKVLENSSRGILICGTGIGMSISANRYKGVRASLCGDTFSARMTRLHNNSNILCLGERVIGKGLAIDIVDTWLNTSYEGGRHEYRIEKIEQDS